jgi:hypothetical protein
MPSGNYEIGENSSIPLGLCEKEGDNRMGSGEIEIDMVDIQSYYRVSSAVIWSAVFF